VTIICDKKNLQLTLQLRKSYSYINEVTLNIYSQILTWHDVITFSMDEVCDQRIHFHLVTKV
jgi:hypothetical protein